MPHFFIKSVDIFENTVIISDSDTVKHLKNSLRTKVGDNLLLVDENKVQYEVVVKEINSKNIVAVIDKKYLSKRILPFQLYLAQSFLHSDAQHQVIQKATELGVKGIYPIITDNCTVKKTVISAKKERLEKIAYEAAKQCERPDIPQIYDVKTLEELLKLTDFKHIFFFVERYENKTLKEAIKETNISKDDKILLVIGPEGGFSKREFDIMEKENYLKITLGNLILRADTAVIVAVSNTIHELS